MNAACESRQQILCNRLDDEDQKVLAIPEWVQYEIDHPKAMGEGQCATPGLLAQGGVAGEDSPTESMPVSRICARLLRGTSLQKHLHPLSR